MSKFSVIVADPPWSFNDKLVMDDTPRGAGSNYSLMSNKDIKDLPIKDFSDPNGSILALWVPSSLLQEGLYTMKSWGFTHKQTYVWVKVKKNPLEPFKSIVKLLNKSSLNISSDLVKKCMDNFSISNIMSFGMGRLFRQTHEICLIGTNNNNIYKLLNNRSQRSVCFAENLKHSAKPDFLQNSLDIMFPNNDFNKIELFARRQRSGWLCLGNECPMTKGEDIRISLNKLISISEKDIFAINKIVSYYNESKEKELFEKWNLITL